MILTVDHVTRYSYDRPVRGVVQSHRLSRSRFDRQKVIDWQVTVSGTMGGGFRDDAGDWVQGRSVAGPVTDIEVHVRGRIETSDLAGLLTGHREIIFPEAYPRETDPTKAGEGVCQDHAHALIAAAWAAKVAVQMAQQSGHARKPEYA